LIAPSGCSTYCHPKYTAMPLVTYGRKYTDRSSERSRRTEFSRIASGRPASTVSTGTAIITHSVCSAARCTAGA
jgi:hypothetical protein